MKISFFLSLLIVISLAATAQQNQAGLPQAKNGFIVISHRGNHVQVPENTVASIREAIKAGADYAEIDLRTTKDGHLVICHDASVDRTTNGKGNVKDLTLDEIKKLKIISLDKSNTKTYLLPEFSEILKACKKNINIYLDFKDADVEETYRQIKAAGMEKRVVVYLNKESQYPQWRKTAPGMPLMASLPETITTKEQLSIFLDHTPLEVVDNIYDSVMVSEARKKGVSIWLDVESADENPAIWNDAMRKGIQGMQTDHPEDLVKYLKQNNLRDGPTGILTNIEGHDLPAYRRLPDVPYSKIDPAANILDAYLPLEYDHARVIVYLHGGGWSEGDKNELPKPLIEELTGKRKYILVSMNYRLAQDGKNLFPAQLEDIGNALAFLSAHAKKYHYNSDEFVLIGASAGAHLAMLYAYGYDSAKQIKAVVDFFGPTDLTDPIIRTRNKLFDSRAANWSGTADPQSQISVDASPYYRLTKETGVPTILFHGGADSIIHFSQSEKIYKKLLSLNIAAQYKFYPQEGHGFSTKAGRDALIQTLVWLEKYYPAQ